MKFLFILITAVIGSQSFAGWTTKAPESGIVWSYDRECVDLKLKNGKILRVQRKAFGDKKLETHKTVIEFHRESLTEELCK